MKWKRITGSLNLLEWLKNKKTINENQEIIFCFSNAFWLVSCNSPGAGQQRTSPQKSFRKQIFTTAGCMDKTRRYHTVSYSFNTIPVPSFYKYSCMLTGKR